MENEQASVTASVPPAHPELRRDEDFVSRYANNVQVESNSFDLKLTFGVLDMRGAAQAPAKIEIDQHTSINLPWLQVKLLIYYMQLHLAGHEKENGKIKIPLSAMPQEVPENPAPPFDNPEGREAFDMLRKMRAEFIAKLSEP